MKTYFNQFRINEKQKNNIDLIWYFENYNTTLFAIGIEQTLPIFIGTRLRVLISPAMNALGVVFICLTLCGALVYELLRRKEAL